MIASDKFMSINFIKKEPLTGSMQGMRYRMEKVEEKLLVTIWPEPFCFEKTEDNKKQTCEFSFDKEGLIKAIDWLNDQYKTNIGFWRSVNTMEIR